MPIVKFGSVQQYESTYEDVSPDSCLVLDAAYKELFMNLGSEHILHFQPGKAIKFVLRISSSYKDFYVCHEPMLSHIRENHYKIRGLIWSYTVANKLLAASAPNDPSDYIIMWIPIE